MSSENLLNVDIESKLLSSFVAEHGSSYGVTIDSKLIDLPNSEGQAEFVEKISQNKPFWRRVGDVWVVTVFLIMIFMSQSLT